MHGIVIQATILMTFSSLFIFKGVAAASSEHKQSACHNSNAILDCKYFANIKSSSPDLQWLVRDNASHKWQRIAMIKRGNRKLFKTPRFDDRITLHTNGSLEIKSLRPEDATLYKCKVSKTGQRDTHFIELSVRCNGKVTITKQEVCVEDDVLLECQAKQRTNPLHVKRVMWHKKDGSAWTKLASDANDSLLLPAGRQPSEMKYKCDVLKNIPSRERHIVVVKSVKCQQERRDVKATIKTTKGRIAMTTSTLVQGTTVAMETTTAPVTTESIAQRSTQPTPVITESHVCGGDLTSVSGGFHSPNFPSAYPANSYCKWTISVPQDYAAIDITLDKMNLEPERECQSDYIAMSDELGNQVGCRHCGSHNKPIKFKVRGRVAVVEFKSDSTVNKTGFKLSYKATK